MKDYGIYEKVKLNGIVPGRLIRHTRADSAIIKSHWHPELEINTVFEGSSRFFINGRIEDVTPSHVVVINSREVHSSIPFFPQAWHKITPLSEDLEFYIEFYCKKEDLLAKQSEYSPLGGARI